ncbi:MAG: hypothetical protein OXB89_08345 [Anaerolineaceae bacterium]|nr:hypothetical protein [Anaerolineaceae bacterium]
MPGPVFTFGFILATLHGAIFHIVVGGDVRRLALFMLAAWAGFALGQLMAISLDLSVLLVGEIHLGPASLCALVALVLVHLLTRSQSRPR